MRIIPAIDIIDGKAVRLEQGDFERVKTYAQDAVTLAKSYEEAGCRYLHVVDLDGAREGAVKNWRVLEALSNATSLQINFGGGLASDEDLRIVMDSGASQIVLGSMPIRNPELLERWLIAYGPELFILAADVRNGHVQIHGWQEDSGLTLKQYINRFMAQGFRNYLCTDISRDGLLEGPNLSLYSDNVREFRDLQLIASGGVSRVEDLYRLQEAGAHAVVIGKALLEGKIQLSELKPFLV